MDEQQARESISRFAKMTIGFSTALVKNQASDLLRIKVLENGFDYDKYVKTGLLIKQSETPNTEAHTEPKPPETKRKSIFDECKQCKKPFKKNVHHQKFCSGKCKDTFHNLRKAQT